MSGELSWDTVRELFDAVCELDPSQRRATLVELGASPQVIEEVLALCSAQTVGARLLAPVAGMLHSLEPELPAGARLGPWRIVSTLAEGGMGRVYLAERDDGQYQQRVAIKLLRTLTTPDDEQLLLRERQILADLQHPSIARLLDGGRSAEGQPYLVMEYVDGLRIDHWCRQHALGLDARLRMFQQVCAAVHHAHQHLVLHCDLKPSNILVREDGQVVLLDFGIARLIDADARGESAGSGYMTPRYASPEQRSGAALSTGTDVYSLGVVLSELLAPADDPERSDATEPTLAPSHRALRHALPWARRLRGDIDAVVLRATAEDPGQRYPSAQQLSEDIERHFRHLPLRARGRSAWYLASRLLRRSWLLVVALAVLAVVSTVFTWRLVEQRDRALEAEARATLEAATADRVIEYLISIFENADPEASGDPDITARELLDAGRREIDSGLAGQPALRGRLAMTLGWIYMRIGQPLQARALFQESADLLTPEAPVEQRIELLDALAHALWHLDENDAAEAHAREAVALAESLPDPRNALLGNALNTLGILVDEAQRSSEALALFQRALEVRRVNPGPRTEGTAATLHNLGMTHRNLGRLDAAADYYRQAIAIKRELHGELHPRMLASVEGLARVHAAQGDYTGAEARLREALGLRLQLHGAESIRVADVQNELGSVIHDQGRYREAAALYRQSIELYARLVGPRSMSVAVGQNNLASALEEMGDLAAAEPRFRESLEIRREAQGDAHLSVARSRNNLARLLNRQGRLSEAGELLAAALAIRVEQLGPDHPETLGSRLNLADLQLSRGDVEAAASELGTVAGALAAIENPLPLHRAALLRVQARLSLARSDIAAAVVAYRSLSAMLATRVSDQHPLWAEALLLAEELTPPELRDANAIRRAAAIVERELVAQAPARVLAQQLLLSLTGEAG